MEILFQYLDKNILINSKTYCILEWKILSQIFLYYCKFTFFRVWINIWQIGVMVLNFIGCSETSTRKRIKSWCLLKRWFVMKIKTFRKFILYWFYKGTAQPTYLLPTEQYSQFTSWDALWNIKKTSEELGNVLMTSQKPNYGTLPWNTIRILILYINDVLQKQLWYRFWRKQWLNLLKENSKP